MPQGQYALTDAKPIGQYALADAQAAPSVVRGTHPEARIGAPSVKEGVTLADLQDDPAAAMARIGQILKADASDPQTWLTLALSYFGPKLAPVFNAPGARPGGPGAPLSVVPEMPPSAPTGPGMLSRTGAVIRDAARSGQLADAVSPTWANRFRLGRELYGAVRGPGAAPPAEPPAVAQSTPAAPPAAASAPPAAPVVRWGPPESINALRAAAQDQGYTLSPSDLKVNWPAVQRGGPQAAVEIVQKLKADAAASAAPAASAPGAPAPRVAPDAPLSAPTPPSLKGKLSAAETPVYSLLRKAGKSHQAAMDLIQAQRDLVARLGLPTAEDVRQAVTDRNLSGRWEE